MGILVPSIPTYGIIKDDPEPITPIINVISVGDSYKLDAFRPGFLGTATQRLVGTGIDETPEWLEITDEYKKLVKGGTETVTSGQHTLFFPEEEFVDNLYTVRGEVRTDDETAQVDIIKQYKTSFVYYSPIAGELWWSAIKH